MLLSWQSTGTMIVPNQPVVGCELQTHGCNGIMVIADIHWIVLRINYTPAIAKKLYSSAFTSSKSRNVIFQHWPQTFCCKSLWHFIWNVFVQYLAFTSKIERCPFPALLLITFQHACCLRWRWPCKRDYIRDSRLPEVLFSQDFHESTFSTSYIGVQVDYFPNTCKDI